MDGRDLRLRLIGPLAVVRAGDHVTIGSRKARSLLALLAVERGRLVSVDRVIEALWGQAWPSRPAENVATLVSRLRSVLGAQVIVGGRAGYRLGDVLSVDLWEGADLVRRAEALSGDGKYERALATGRRALGLLDHAVVLADQPDAGWAGPARSAQVDLLRRARLVVAEAALGGDDARAARVAAEAAVDADRLDETACRALMRAHQAAGEPARALAVYASLRSTLAEEMGIDPAEATSGLYLEILRSTTDTEERGGSRLEKENELLRRMVAFLLGRVSALS